MWGIISNFFQYSWTSKSLPFLLHCPHREKLKKWYANAVNFPPLKPINPLIFSFINQFQWRSWFSPNLRPIKPPVLSIFPDSSGKLCIRYTFFSLCILLVTLLDLFIIIQTWFKKIPPLETIYVSFYGITFYLLYTSKLLKMLFWSLWIYFLCIRCIHSL